MLSIYNLANVAPRSTTDLNLAADDVEEAYRAILAQVESAGGRVVNSQLTKPTPEQTTGTIAFEVAGRRRPTCCSAPSAARARSMRLETSTNPDTQNSPTPSAGSACRCGRSRRSAARVGDAATRGRRRREQVRQAARRAAGCRRGSSQSEINQQDPNQTTATLEVDVRRDQRAAVDKALADAGGVYGRAVVAPGGGRGGAGGQGAARASRCTTSTTSPPARRRRSASRRTTSPRPPADVESTAVAARRAEGRQRLGPAARRADRSPASWSTSPSPSAAELIDKARGQGRVLTVQRDQNPVVARRRLRPRPPVGDVRHRRPDRQARPEPRRQHPLGPVDERAVAAAERDVDGDRAVPGRPVGAGAVARVEARAAPPPRPRERDEPRPPRQVRRRTRRVT